VKTSIWKYRFPPEDEFELEMPRGARILHVAMLQGGDRLTGGPCIWALVQTEQPMVKRKFSLRGTGHDCDDLDLYRPPGERSDFVGTFFVYGDGSLVFHLFDRGEQK